MRLSVLLVVLAGLALAVGPAGALVSQYAYPTTGDLAPAVPVGQVPRADIAAVMSFPGRIYADHGISTWGYPYGGEWDHVYWRGTTADFNRFLQVYSGVKLPCRPVVMHSARPLATAVWSGPPLAPGGGPAAGTDWHYTWSFVYHVAGPGLPQGAAKETVQVQLWIGGVELDRLQVPANIVLLGGTEIEGYVTAPAEGKTPAGEQ